ncbi:hypothetical protein BDQ17DRAFT_1267743, partial [Cyathus striatus]
AQKTKIQLIQCTVCPPLAGHYIGPDCRSIEVLNLNNRYLFTHELLEHYTSAFSTSPTPFVAFIQNITRAYKNSLEGVPFVSDKIFHSAWFSYADLLSWGNDLTCQHCGPTLDEVIFDGVSISFSRKQF